MKSPYLSLQLTNSKSSSHKLSRHLSCANHQNRLQHDQTDFNDRSSFYITRTKTATQVTTKKSKIPICHQMRAIISSRQFLSKILMFIKKERTTPRKIPTVKDTNIKMTNRTESSMTINSRMRNNLTSKLWLRRTSDSLTISEIRKGTTS